MTDAPDPGLTDLLAAHLNELIADAPASNYEEDDYNAGYVAALIDLRESDALALVVEQHTNGRIAELEAERNRAVVRMRAALKRTQIRIGEIRRTEALKATADLAWMAAYGRAEKWKMRAIANMVRAEKAEATVARVEELTERGERHGSEIWAGNLRAALEGEQR